MKIQDYFEEQRRIAREREEARTKEEKKRAFRQWVMNNLVGFLALLVSFASLMVAIFK